MKRTMQAVIFIFLVVIGTSAWALPLDLSTFSADTGVSETGGVVSFTEQEQYGAIYFYNDSFIVPSNAGDLTYNFSLTPGDQNDDYLVAVIDFTNYLMEINTPGTGSGSIDMRSYQGQTISLAFGMESNDLVAGSVATISDLDLGVTAVPEPSSVLLLCVGFMGLLYFRRKAFSVS